MSNVAHQAEETCLKNHLGNGLTKTPQTPPTCTALNAPVLPDGPSAADQQDTFSDAEKAPWTATKRTDSSGPSTPPSDEPHYPEGGLEAWLVVAGSFSAQFMVFGIVNSTAAFQSYLSTHQLAAYTPSQIGWIFSVELFLVFFCGIYLGPIFDRYGPRYLVLAGSLASIASLMLLSVCTEYWHFMLSYSILGGVGGASLLTPAFACIAHFFCVRRGLASGIATVAGSVGGVVVPIMLQNLLPSVGFGWSARILGFMFIILAVPANVFLKHRFSSQDAGFKLLPDLRILAKPCLALCAAGIFFMEWGLFSPLAYISSYCEDVGLPSSFGLTALAVLNAGSFFGRCLPGWLADRVGRFNVIIATIALCAVTALAVWLPAGSSRAAILAFAVLFGFASGSNIGLIAVCLGQLCRPDEYGRFFAAAYFVASFGTLTSVPIGGQLLAAAGGAYWGLIVFTGVSYALAVVCYAGSRVLAVGWNPRTFF